MQRWTWMKGSTYQSNGRAWAPSSLSWKYKRDTKTAAAVCSQNTGIEFQFCDVIRNPEMSTKLMWKEKCMCGGTDGKWLMSCWWHVVGLDSTKVGVLLVTRQSERASFFLLTVSIQVCRQRHGGSWLHHSGGGFEWGGGRWWVFKGKTVRDKKKKKKEPGQSCIFSSDRVFFFLFGMERKQGDVKPQAQRMNLNFWIRAGNIVLHQRHFGVWGENPRHLKSSATGYSNSIKKVKAKVSK